MIAPIRFMDFADQTQTKAIMRLGWSMPMLNDPLPFSFVLADDVWINPNMRHPYQNRQARIHALWQIGCRKQAQEVYWKGKLKRKVRR